MGSILLIVIFGTAAALMLAVLVAAKLDAEARDDPMLHHHGDWPEVPRDD
ncbi:MAG: hypothetical protein ABII76_18540 [Pseudomonadota bacterium]